MTPVEANKAPTGPLQGFYRVRLQSNTRAIYKVKVEKLADGNELIHLKVMFVRRRQASKEHDKLDTDKVG